MLSVYYLNCPGFVSHGFTSCLHFFLTAGLVGGRTKVLGGNRSSWLKRIEKIGIEAVYEEEHFDFSLAKYKGKESKAEWEYILQEIQNKGK